MCTLCSQKAQKIPQEDKQTQKIKLNKEKSAHAVILSSTIYQETVR